MTRIAKLGTAAAAIAALCVVGGFAVMNYSASASPGQPGSSAPASDPHSPERAARDMVAGQITREGSVGDLATRFAGVDLGPDNGLIVYAAPSATEDAKSQIVELADGVPVTFVSAPYSYAQLSAVRMEITAMELPNVVEISIGHDGQHVQVAVSDGVDQTAKQLEAKFPGIIKVIETSPAQMGMALPQK